MSSNDASEQEAMKVMYEARRQARGRDGEAKRVSWVRRLITWSSVSVLVIGGGVGGYLWWAAGRVVATQATLCAAVVSLSPDADGRLKEILVKPGNKVEKGQLLLRLDDSELRAALTGAEAQKRISESRYTRAVAERERVKADVEAQIDLSRARVAVAAARVAGAEAVLERRKSHIEPQIRFAESQRDEAKANFELLKKGPKPEEIEVAKLRVATAMATVDFFTLDVQQIQHLVNKGFDSAYSVRSKELDLTSQQNQLKEAALNLARLTAGPDPAALEAAMKALAAREAALDIVLADKKDVDVLTADLLTVEASHLEAKAALKLAEAQRLQIDLLDEEIKAARAEFARAEADEAGRRAALTGAAIESPISGTVIRTFGNIGEFCRRGTPVVLVADDSEGRWVEAFVNERDAARVREGQRASLEIIDGSGDYVDIDATVALVGLATSSLTASGENPSASTVAAPAKLVWVKLRSTEEIAHLRPGTSARAVIKVR